MNLLMILIIVLAVWVCGAICYFAWRLVPEVESPDEATTKAAPQDSDVADAPGKQ